MPFAKSNFTVSLDELIVASSSKEAASVEGFRHLYFKAGVFPGTRGTAYVEFGETRVLAKIDGPRESSDGDFHSGSVSVSLSGVESKSLRAQMVSALSGVIQLRKYAKSRISVEINVLSADGGILQAALVASSLALTHAGIEMLDVVVACHVAVTPTGEHLLDPSAALDGDCAEVTLALMPNLNQIVCCDTKGVLTRKSIAEAVTFASKKALQLYPFLRKAVVDSLV